MFDFAWSELGLVALVAVLILGPKQLPQAMRTMARVVRKIRGMASEFQGHFNDMIRDAELEDVQKSVQKLSSTNISSEVSKMIDPKGEINDALKVDPIKESKDSDSDALSEPQEALSIETPESKPVTEPEESPSASRGQTP